MYYVVFCTLDNDYYICEGINNLSNTDEIIDSYATLFKAESRLALELNRKD